MTGCILSKPSNTVNFIHNLAHLRFHFMQKKRFKKTLINARNSGEFIAKFYNRTCLKAAGVHAIC